jgi:lysozyme family protein
MKDNFNLALANVLKSEGLWSDNPQDPGGATMKGITLETYRAWKRNPHITKEQLKAIPDVDVYDLYKQEYWDKINGDNLPIGVDYAVFDAAVNMGVGRASKLLQEAVGVTADGVIGNGTLQAISKANTRSLLENFAAEKTAFYKSLSTFPTFGVGWLRRVADVKTISESMLG